MSSFPSHYFLEFFRDVVKKTAVQCRGMRPAWFQGYPGTSGLDCDSQYPKYMHDSLVRREESWLTAAKPYGLHAASYLIHKLLDTFNIRPGKVN